MTPTQRKATKLALEALLAIRFRMGPERQAAFPLVREQLIARATDSIDAIADALLEPQAEPVAMVAEVARQNDGQWSAIVLTGDRELQSGDKLYTATQPTIPPGYKLVSAGAIQMVVNALRRDAAEGKKVRGEMADELLAAPEAPQSAKRETDAWSECVETACAPIKAADDAAADGDYMLDSDDCIKVLRGQWKAPLVNDCPPKPHPAKRVQIIITGPCGQCGSRQDPCPCGNVNTGAARGVAGENH
jgi:hypothetical protein